MDKGTKIRRLWRKARIACKALYHFSRTLQDVQIYGSTKHHYSECSALKMYARESLQPLSRFVLLRSSRVRQVWSGLMYTGLFWTVTVELFVMSFMDNPDDDWLRMEGPLGFMCLLDILISFFSAYKDESRQLVTDLHSIAKHYIKNWFLVDAMSSLSIFSFCERLIVSTSTSASNLYEFAYIIRILKFFKPDYYMSWIKWLRNVLGKANIRILKLFVVVMMLVHLLSCLWFLTTRWSGLSAETWIMRYNWMENSPSENYILSMTYIFTTLATVGGSDMTAYSMEERSFSICLMVFGVGFISYTISFVSMMINHSESSELQCKLDAIENFARTIALPQNLTKKVVAHLKHTCMHESRTWQQRERVLHDLPLFLSSELSLFMHHKLVSQVTFFQDKDPGFISEIVPKLQVIFFESQKVVYSENSFSDEIYFIMKGRVRLLKQNVPFITYVSGSYFGELDIIWGRVRNATANTEEPCEMLVLSKTIFLKMLDTFANIREEILEVAHIRESRNMGALKDALGFEEAKRVSVNSPVKKKSLRMLLQRENNRIKWRRLNTLDQSVNDDNKWDIALRHHARQESRMLLVSAERVFTPLERDARWNFVRRKKKALLSNVPVLVESITPKDVQMKSVMIRLKEYENKLQQGYHRLATRLRRIISVHDSLKEQVLSL